MMFVSFNNRTTGVNSETRTAHSPGVHPVFCGVRVAQSLGICAVVCRLLFVSLLSLYCLSFFDLRPLNNPLVASNFVNDIVSLPCTSA
jgi:hypothetical protein